MTPAQIFDPLLGLSVLTVGLAAVVVRRRETAVTLFLVFGVLLAIVWARLAAPDIALAEAALGAGVTGALLVDALGARSRRATIAVPAPRRGAILAAIGAGCAVLGVLVVAVRHLSTPDRVLADRVAAELTESGVDHGITAVLLNFRSYDTLLEVAVLAVAAFAALAFLGRDEPAWADPWPQGPPPALRGLVRGLTPLAVLIAIWLLVAGTTRPGGAFQSGALLAALLIMLHLAGRRAWVPCRAVLGSALFAGLLVFLALALTTAVLGAGWLVLDPSWAGAVILALEATLALSIGAGLAVVFLADRAALPGRTGGGERS